MQWPNLVAQIPGITYFAIKRHEFFACHLVVLKSISQQSFGRKKMIGQSIILAYLQQNGLWWIFPQWMTFEFQPQKTTHHCPYCSIEELQRTKHSVTLFQVFSKGILYGCILNYADLIPSCLSRKEQQRDCVFELVDYSVYSISNFKLREFKKCLTSIL